VEPLGGGYPTTTTTHTHPFPVRGSILHGFFNPLRQKGYNNYILCEMGVKVPEYACQIQTGMLRPPKGYIYLSGK